MRDFNNSGDINVNGDFKVEDNSHVEHQLLIHCSSKLLLQERPFRKENIKIEQKKKVKRLKPFYGLSIALFVCAAIWFQINGEKDIATLIMGCASLYIGYLSVQGTFNPNTFQREEQKAVNEINEILKKRRVE